MDPLTDTCEHGNETRSCLPCRRRARTWQEQVASQPFYGPSIAELLEAEHVTDDDYAMVDPQVTYEEIVATLDKVNNMLFGVNNLLKDLCWKLEKRRR